MKNTARKGFTLIELLVVIAIIGLLSTLAVVALNSARAKSRDAKRISDVKQVQTALELYFADQGGYPSPTAGLVLGGTGAGRLCDAGFQDAACTTTTYMGQVPAAPTPPSANTYAYTGKDSAGVDCTSGGKCASYEILFTLEGQTGSLALGSRTATPNGIQ